MLSRTLPDEVSRPTTTVDASPEERNYRAPRDTLDHVIKQRAFAGNRFPVVHYSSILGGITQGTFAWRRPNIAARYNAYPSNFVWQCLACCSAAHNVIFLPADAGFLAIQS